MSLSAELQDSLEEQSEAIRDPTLKWEKLSEEWKQSYSFRVNNILHNRPSLINNSCQNRCRCADLKCQESIQSEYNCLIHCLKDADSILPRTKPGSEKEWWTDHLTELRNESVAITVRKVPKNVSIFICQLTKVYSVIKKRMSALT